MKDILKKNATGVASVQSMVHHTTQYQKNVVNKQRCFSKVSINYLVDILLCFCYKNSYSRPMEIPHPTEAELAEFKALYKARFGVRLAETEALELALSVLALVKYKRDNELFRQRKSLRPGS